MESASRLEEAKLNKTGHVIRKLCLPIDATKNDDENETQINKTKVNTEGKWKLKNMKQHKREKKTREFTAPTAKSRTTHDKPGYGQIPTEAKAVCNETSDGREQCC